MNPARLKHLLENVRAGKSSVAKALDELRDLPYEDLGYARLDHHRALRQGIPEVIFSQGKTRDQILEIAAHLGAGENAVVATRLDADDAAAIADRFPRFRYSKAGRVGWIPAARATKPAGGVIVISAGTADLPVAEEASVTAECAGLAVDRLYDVGVSGLHRLFGEAERLKGAEVVIVVAGMEGALPSVVGGWADQPVIAVPTSIGYGASFGGLAALLSMLNSCAAGVTVVNIDNGFGAAIAAVRILRSRKRAKR